VSGNSGAWGVAMWRDGYSEVDGPAQEQGISLEGGDPVLPFLPTDPVGTLLVPPVGLGVPAIRAGDVAFAQRDGVVQFADYYEPRQLTFQVLVQNDGCPGCSTPMSARQKVSRLTQEWSRNCSGATLVLFTDCHNPDASDEERVYNGPYLVHGRPRVADVVWERSNRGAARVTLRFDAADARLVLVDTIPGTFWTSEHVQTIEAVDQNLVPDPDLSSLTMTLNGATVDDAHVQSGGPNDGPFFRRIIEAPNTTSPMQMNLTGTGTSGIPVSAGVTYSFAWWARKDPAGGPASRIDWAWYDAGGALLGPSTNSGAAKSPTATWQRFDQQLTAPVGAAFVQIRLIWTGVGLVDQRLEFAQAWLNAGATPTEPETVEIVGTLCAYPVFRLRPNLTAPIVVTYGNHQFTYTEDIGPGDAVDVDTRWGRASDGFEDVTVNVEGDFISPLAPGVHEFTVQTGDPADTGFVTLSWENAVVSG
jgi:hypothetical protein